MENSISSELGKVDDGVVALGALYISFRELLSGMVSRI